MSVTVTPIVYVPLSKKKCVAETLNGVPTPLGCEITPASMWPSPQFTSAT